MNFFNRNKIKDYFGIKSQKLTGFFQNFAGRKIKKGLILRIIRW